MPESSTLAAAPRRPAVLADPDGHAGDARPAPVTDNGVLPRTRRGRWFVVAVLVLAAVARLGVIAWDRHYTPAYDGAHFDAIAKSIAHGDGYGNTLLPMTHGPSAYRAPLYPTVLSAAYVVTGDSVTAGRIENALIGVGLVALIGVVAAQLWSRRVAAVALVIAALHPTLWLYGSGLQLEPLLALLIVGATAAALQHRRAPRGLWWPAIAGVIVGLGALTRETAFLLLPGLAWLVWTARPRWTRRAVLAPVLLVVIACATVAPWTIRNAVRLHAFVPVSTSGGYSIAGTYNDTAMHNPTYPAIWMPPEQDPALRQLILDHEPLTEVQLDSLLRTATKDYVRDHPGSLPKAMFWNVVRLFDLQGTGHALYYGQFVPYPPGLTKLAVYSSLVLLVFALVALVSGALRRSLRAVWLFPAVAIVLYSVVSGTLRYRASIEPFTVLLASYGVVRIVDAARRRRARSSAPTSVAAA